MTFPLLWPWISAARSAWSEARKPSSGGKRPRQRPQVRAALLHLLLFWLGVVMIIGGSLGLYRWLTRATEVDIPHRELALVVDASTSALEDQPLDAPGPDQVQDSVENETREEALQRIRRVTAQSTMLRAQAACQASDYQTCLTLADEARRVDPRLPEAIRLFHLARLALTDNTGDNREVEQSSEREADP